jgi:FAD/FMN-containing dehydrogenase
MSISEVKRQDPSLGRLVRPGDPGWDTARQAFNTRVDQRPEAIAFPSDEREVAAVVRYARRHGLRVAAQATGHNAAPLGALDGTVLINTSRLSSVSIDPAGPRVRAGAGVKWGHVVPRLSDLGLAALHGSSPDIGIAGYSVGGGMGWQARKHGLHSNAVEAFELVTADGERVRTDPTSEPDLFWALRGGGGSFGVVTAVEFAVRPLEEVYAGALFFPSERAGEVLHAWHALLPSFPDELMTWAALMQFPPLPFVPEHLRGRAFAVVLGAFLGDAAHGRDLLHELVALDAEIDTFAVVPPVGLSELAMDPPQPLPYASAHALLSALPSAAIDDLVATVDMHPGAPLVLVQLRHMGGALARRPPGAGARATLPGHLSMMAAGLITDEASARAVETALHALTTSVTDHRVGHYPGLVEQPTDAGRFFDETTWTRLRRVKRHYDPWDLIRGNHHIPPA